MSPIGRNIIICERRYHFRFHDFALGLIHVRYIKHHFSGTFTEKNIATSEFIKELVSLREKSSFFMPAPLLFTQTEILDIVYVATNLARLRKP